MKTNPRGSLLARTFAASAARAALSGAARVDAHEPSAIQYLGRMADALRKAPDLACCRV